MTDQELRKLSRKDLLEILLVQEKERAALEKELEEAKALLHKREIQIEQAGSIAEAALQLNGVFDAAQAAIQQYQENVMERCRQQELDCRRKIEETVRQAQEWVQRTQEDTMRKCQEMERQAKVRVEAIQAETSMYDGKQQGSRRSEQA